MAESRIVQAVQKEDFLRALAFVLPHEKTSCALTRKILDREEGVYLIERGRDRGAGSERERTRGPDSARGSDCGRDYDRSRAGGASSRPVVDGVFFFVEDDILLPCLAGIRSGGLKALAAFLDGKKLFCISGLEEELRKLRPLLAGLPHPPRLRERRDYFFLEHTDRAAAGQAIAALPADCRMQMAGPADEAALLPLHYAYVREEVLLPGGRLNEGFERRQLHEALEKQVVVMAVCPAVRDAAVPSAPDAAALSAPDGAEGPRPPAGVLAKAGTNAIASKVMQLGGVYTIAGERGRGLAAALTAFLAESAARKGFATVLFVHKKNPAAIAAYRRAGFTDSGRAYTIEYYS